jgi:DNA polymerase
MNKLYLDFETYSEANLKKVGAPLYAAHPSTGIHCYARAREKDPEPFIYDAYDESGGYIHDGDLWKDADSSLIFVAHNALFEQSIYRSKLEGYPELPIERWRCTMAKCLAWGLPAGLGEAAKVLKIPAQKDMEGRATMLALSKPKKDGTFWTYDQAPEKFDKLYSYCQKDVDVMRQIDELLPDLSPKELEVWFMDQRINQQGIYLDLPLVRKAMEFNEQYDTEQQQRFISITGGIPSASRQRTKLLKWLNNHGVPVRNTQSATLKSFIRNRKDVSENIRTVIKTCISAGKSSVAKYKKMALRSDDTGCAKEILQYHGAHTGRWSGKGIQIQNLLRPTVDPDAAIQALQELDYDSFKVIYQDVSGALASCLRRVIIAPLDRSLIGADFSQIEARVLAYLAGQTDVLEAFISGRDLYCEQASKIYGFPVLVSDKARRLVGKVAVLALGYGGGIGAFAKMCQAYSVSLRPIFSSLWSMATADEREFAEWSYDNYAGRAKSHGYKPVSREVGLAADIIKQRWRDGNEKVVAYWRTVEEAARRTITTGDNTMVGGVSFYRYKQWLSLRLPSDRSIHFVDPHIKADGSLGYWGVDSITKRWKRLGTYGGKLTENIVQAVARDVMVDAMLRVDNRTPVYFTVHDELVCVGGAAYKPYFKEAVVKQPKWASGLPIACEYWNGDRYGK